MDQTEQINFLLKDGENVSADKAAMMKCVTVKGMVDDGTAAEEAIPLPDINKETFDKVVVFCKYL